MKRKPSTLPSELSELTASIWLAQGTIRLTDYGQENTYYIDEFGNEFFCKDYPIQNREAA